MGPVKIPLQAIVRNFIRRQDRGRRLLDMSEDETTKDSPRHAHLQRSLRAASCVLLNETDSSFSRPSSQDISISPRRYTHSPAHRTQSSFPTGSPSDQRQFFSCHEVATGCIIQSASPATPRSSTSHADELSVWTGILQGTLAGA